MFLKIFIGIGYMKTYHTEMNRIRKFIMLIINDKNL